MVAAGAGQRASRHAVGHKNQWLAATRWATTKTDRYAAGATMEAFA